MQELQDECRCVIVAGARACAFLNGVNQCSIYPTRPSDCVAMQAGDEQCQACREDDDLPPLEKTGIHIVG